MNYDYTVKYIWLDENGLYHLEVVNCMMDELKNLLKDIRNKYNIVTRRVNIFGSEIYRGNP